MGMLDIFRGKTSEDAKATEKAVADFQNPFKKSGISHISLRIYNLGVFSGFSSMEGQIDFDATIAFKSGGTSGEHKIKAANFAELVEKVNGFVKSMG